MATSLVAAAAEVLGSADLLLCSRPQAAELGLHWRPVGELPAAARGYRGRRRATRGRRRSAYAAARRRTPVPRRRAGGAAVSVTRVLRAAREALDEAGLRGSFLVRDLDSGDELGIDPETRVPGGVPGEGAARHRHPGTRSTAANSTPPPRSRSLPAGPPRAGPTGLSRFRHPATVALDDLLYLSTSLSDETAADALFTLTPPAAVAAELRRLGLRGDRRTPPDGRPDRHPGGEAPARSAPSRPLDRDHGGDRGARSPAAAARRHPRQLRDGTGLRGAAAGAVAPVDDPAGTGRPGPGTDGGEPAPAAAHPGLQLGRVPLVVEDGDAAQPPARGGGRRARRRADASRSPHSPSRGWRPAASRARRR